MNEIYVPSVNFANVWFIFRSSGTEVRVLVVDGMLIPSHTLWDREVRWLEKNAIQKKFLILDSKINENHTDF